MGDLFGDPLICRIFKNDVISVLGRGERFLFSWVLGLLLFFFPQLSFSMSYNFNVWFDWLDGSWHFPSSTSDNLIANW